MGNQKQEQVKPAVRRDGGAPDDTESFGVVIPPPAATAPVTPAVPAVPVSAPGTRPAGPSVTDAVTEEETAGTGDGPVLGWTAAWAKVAVHVDPDQASTREGEDGDELYVTVTGPGGDRDVPLEGQQVTLLAGETLPGESLPGQGALLHSFGAVQAVSVARP